MAGLFWLSDAQWSVIEPSMARSRPGARRVDDRRVASGIMHVIASGGRWRDCLAALAAAGWVAGTAALGSTYIRAHRSAHGDKGARGRKPSAPRTAGQPQGSMSSPT